MSNRATPIRLIAAAALLLSGPFVGACNNNSDSNNPEPWACTAEPRIGPALVTIDCATDALAEDLGESALVVEYSNDGQEWKPCRDGYFEGIAPGTSTINQPVCDSNAPISPSYQCGDLEWEGVEYQFFIRATQGERSAGPVQITTRMKDHCDYDEATLYHELHLDLGQ